MKKPIKILLTVVAALLAVLVIYLLYVVIAYYRLDDNRSLEVRNPSAGSLQTVKKGEEYTIMTWNIGYGAYEPDVDFFMDGGKMAWGKSRDSVVSNMENIKDLIKETDPDFAFFQEVDTDSTRSFHVDERTFLYEALPSECSVYAQNYDSPFLFYPFTQPIGKSVSGILTFSSGQITSSVRRQLPLEGGVRVIFDLDRCYTVSRIPVSTGGELVLVNFHFSAFTKDGKISTEQLDMVLRLMKEEYEKGNWCICGGDFNKDLQGQGSQAFGVDHEPYNWTLPIDKEQIKAYNMKLVDSYDPSNPVPSVRGMDSAYFEGMFVSLVDGFIVSPNVEVKDAHVMDIKFAYSDHNPVLMNFILK
ncbi:MAG: endonuclease/exonuclease/phosphatase family protein [Sphaerochaetaceae bacterium]|nr:endonuclease/exonuclease/phosphatase family protein [Sphaerochaetaceae bacterium]